jgi:hypothetical protein
LNPKDGGKLRSLAWICIAAAGLLLVAPLFTGSTLVGFLILLVKNVKTNCPESTLTSTAKAADRSVRPTHGHDKHFSLFMGWVCKGL